MEPDNHVSSDRGADDPEFHSYRRALRFVYFGVLALGSALLIASIVTNLFFHGHRPDRAAPEPTATDLLSCNHDVEMLLEDLGRSSTELQAQAVQGEAHDLGARWEEFARQKWQPRWEEVLRRCKFDELAETGLGPAYDRMAAVHRELPGMMLRYREMMKRFTNDQARDLEAMRTALDKSRRLLEERAGTPSP